MGFNIRNIRPEIRNRLVVPLEGKLKEESERVDRISERHSISLLHVMHGLEAGLSEEEIVRRVRASEKLGKSRFAISVFLERGEYPSEEEEREVEKGNEEAREMARRSNERLSKAGQTKSRSDDDDDDETFGD